MTAVEIRPPELLGDTEAQKLESIRSYLCVLARQLQVAFDTVSAPGSSAPAPGAASAPMEGEALTRLKSLIIKSARVTQVLEERLEKRLEGRYVAAGEFGTFRQETYQSILANSQALEQHFSAVQTLTDSVNTLTDSVVRVSATVRTGMLSEGLYGVEIGQQELADGVTRFRRYARLTAQGLSFYDNNDVEIAYISDRRMYVTTAQVNRMVAGGLSTPSVDMEGYLWQTGVDGHLSLR